MFIVKDQLCDATKWHIRTVPAHPAEDPYFPIGQASLTLLMKDGAIHAVLETLTPNFRTYEVQIDCGPWKPAGTSFLWPVHSGSNRLAARTVNRFGVTGPVSTADVDVSK